MDEVAAIPSFRCEQCKQQFPLTRWEWLYLPNSEAWLHRKCGWAVKIDSQNERETGRE